MVVPQAVPARVTMAASAGGAVVVFRVMIAVMGAHVFRHNNRRRGGIDCKVKMTQKLVCE
jgi:hypothetical protein